MGTHRAMFLLVWTFIFVSSLIDTRNLQVHSKFILIETGNDNYDSPQHEDYSAKCEDIDKRQCHQFSKSCHENDVANLCRKTCGLCPGGRVIHGGICIDRDTTNCPKFSHRCETGTVANLCRKTCGVCTPGPRNKGF